MIDNHYRDNITDKIIETVRFPTLYAMGSIVNFCVSTETGSTQIPGKILPLFVPYYLISL